MRVAISRLVVCSLFLLAGWIGDADALDLRAKIDPLAQRLLADRAAVGFVVGIYRRGETQVIGYGETKKGDGVTPDGNTVYEIGSITKTFTAVLLADMVQRGAMKLDAPVQTYLPDGVTLGVNGEPITLTHLATHTSGLSRDPENMVPADPRNPFADYTLKQLYRILTARPLRPPGEYLYSNFGMGLLGHVITLQANKGYEELLLERVCLPLDMRDTRPNPTASMLERLAPPYDDRLWPSKGFDLPTLAGAGGIRSTVNDMLKYVRANLVKDDTPLSRAIWLTHRRHYTMKNGSGYGLAWRMSTTGKTLSHGGTTGGYRAFVGVVPGENTGVIVLSNTHNVRVLMFGNQVLRVAVGLSPAGKPEPLVEESE